MNLQNWYFMQVETGHPSKFPSKLEGLGVVEFCTHNRVEPNQHLNYFLNIELNKVSATNTTQPPPNPSSLEGNWLGTMDKKQSLCPPLSLCLCG